jgi:hypothetical protein
MKTHTKKHHTPMRMHKQRGLVLFFALIALVVMSLAAVALIRSVDTSTMIAGNLAFKQAATTSSEGGIEAAGNFLFAIEQANGPNADIDPAHPFNITDLAAKPGYHSSADPALILTDSATWNDVNNALVGEDATGNTVRYIIQRMCRIPNTAFKNADCLFSVPQDDGTNKAVGGAAAAQAASGGGSGGCIGCKTSIGSPQIRVTVRTTGPKNTVSYVQAFVY